MKRLLLFLIAIVAIFNSYSQDIIIKSNGDKIECKISKEDSLNIYFSTIINEKELNTSIIKANVKEVIYQKDRLASQGKNSCSFVETKKSGLGYQYYCNGKLLTLIELTDILKNNDKANSKFNEAKSSSSFGSILAGAGGAFIGYPVGTALAGGKANWVLAGIGAGLIIIAIPIVQSAEKQCKEAVDIYNQGTGNTSMIKKELKFGLTTNGLGFCMRF
jgi:hypothetical protein